MFHENLRSIRENREISQQQMAELIGIPVTTYRNYENTIQFKNNRFLFNGGGKHRINCFVI